MSDSERIVTGISREEVNRLPVRRYGGEICVVASKQDFEQAMQAIGSAKVLGLDTETRPAFSKGEAYLPCLAQIATASAVYIFQLKRKRFIPVLRDMLENPALIKAGIGLREDFRTLQKVFAFKPHITIDLSLVAQQQGIDRSSVRNLAGQFLGFRITKGLATSNWADPQLTDRQITYAATDAWACRELYLHFRKIGFLDQKGIGDVGVTGPKPPEPDPEAEKAKKARRPRRRRRKPRAGKKKSQTKSE